MKELHSLEEVAHHLDLGGDLEGYAVQDVELHSIESKIAACSVTNAIFFGCEMPSSLLDYVVSRGALVFPKLDVPFNPYRANLYDSAELFSGFDPKQPCSYCHSNDAKIYDYWKNTGKSNPTRMVDAVARRLHDQSISDALQEFLVGRSSGSRSSDSKIVAIMGGHGMKRDEEIYSRVAEISRALTRKGYLMISGGGPGAMEATHLGAWFADRDDGDLPKAIKHLSEAPGYQHKEWLAKAFEVKDFFPANGESHISLGIPTWLYGHEPPNPFATHIAKYFNNSIREEGLVTLGSAGIIFSPGSAGTIQEIFQDAAQNHYTTTGFSTPMVFLERKYWTEEKPIYPVLEHLAKGKDYEKLLAIFDTGDEVISFIESNPPIPADKKSWEYCEANCK